MIFGVPELEDLATACGGLEGRRVLLRADFNVPLNDGEIVDDLRVRSALPTIEWLCEAGALVTACSHLGRPKGEVVSKFSLDPVRELLKELAPGVELLENLRFSPGEEANDAANVAGLIEGFDCYVNDAFGASHRSHASIVGPPAHLPAAAGRLLAQEVKVLLGLRDKPRRPFVAIMGGAKISDKLGVIKALLDVVDQIIIGGAMTFTFLKASGHSIGSSLVEDDMVEICAELLKERGDQILLPEDLTALSPEGKLFEPDKGGEVRQFGLELPDGWMGVDIGPGSAAVFADVVAEAGTVLWNGPLGAFEDLRFQAGTKVVAEAVAEAGGYSVIGGGDSAVAAKMFGLDSEVDHLSTGGGASLELLEQGDLVGLAALREGVSVGGGSAI